MNNNLAELDRVRRRTSPRVNAGIDEKILNNIRRYGLQPAEVITRRIDELEREWDIERVLQGNASSLALFGGAMAAAVNRRWLWLSGGVLGFLLLHSIQGWCPPLPMLRRLGVRTRGEIDREKFALRLLRGDFSSVRSGSGAANPERVAQLAAV